MLTKNMLAKIHIAKKELNLSDLIYRDVLRLNTGKESARELTREEAIMILDHFKTLGWKPRKTVDSKQLAVGSNCQPSTANCKPKSKRYDDLANRPGMASPKQLRMIEAMWMTGANIRVKTPQALRTFLQNKFQVADLRFIESHQVGKIVTAIRGIK